MVGRGRMNMRRTGMSPVVEAWSAYRSSNAQDWPLGRLLQAKGGATVGPIVTAIRDTRAAPAGLVDEVIVVDSRSSDRTAAVARAAGARVVSQEDQNRGLYPLHGKGDEV